MPKCQDAEKAKIKNKTYPTIFAAGWKCHSSSICERTKGCRLSQITSLHAWIELVSISKRRWGKLRLHPQCKHRTICAFEITVHTKSHFLEMEMVRYKIDAPLFDGILFEIFDSTDFRGNILQCLQFRWRDRSEFGTILKIVQQF